MTDLVQGFIERTAGGKTYQIRKAYSDQSGLILYAVIDDVEMDLIRVTFDCEGGHANFETKDLTYILLSGYSLKRLAKLCKEAREIYEDWDGTAASDAWLAAQNADTAENADKALERFRALITDDFGKQDPWRPGDSDNG